MKITACNYYWYHHMFVGISESKTVIKRIEEHDFDAFMQYYTWYQLNPLNNPDGWTYFPDEVQVCYEDGSFEYLTVFDRKNFNLITYSESECG